MWQSRRWGVFPLPFTSCRAGSGFWNRSSGQCFPTTSKTTMQDFHPGCSFKKKQFSKQVFITVASLSWFLFLSRNVPMISLKNMASYIRRITANTRLENLTGHTFGDAKSLLDFKSDVGIWPSSCSNKAIKIATSYESSHNIIITIIHIPTITRSICLLIHTDFLSQHWESRWIFS